jgi:hypothetical protein
MSYRIGSQGEPNINSVEVHQQLSTNGHPVDCALVGAGSLWPFRWGFVFCPIFL